MTAAIERQTSPTGPRRQSMAARIGRRWVPLLLIFASFVMGFTVTAHHSARLSPIDEWVYADYLNKLPEQLFIHRGEQIGPEALQMMACTGVREYGPMGPPCGSDYSANLDKFPQGGISSADAYTPLYFVITWVGAKAIQAVTDLSLLQAARFTGAFWLAGSMLLFYWLLRLLRIKPVVALGLGLAVIASPFAWWTFTFVSTDAPVFAFGALLMIAALKFVRGEWSGWWLPLIGVVATLFKVTNLLAVAFVALYLVIEFCVRRIRERPRRRGFEFRNAFVARGDDGLFAIAVITAVASLLAEVGWLVLHSALAIGASAEQGLIHPLRWEDLGRQLINFLPNTIISNVVIAGRDAPGLPIPPYFVAPLSWVCIAGVVGALALFTWRRTNWALVLTIAISSVLFAPLLALALSYQGIYFPIPSRYGASILPGFLVAAAFVIRSRFAVALLIAYSGLLLIYILIRSPAFA